MKSILSMILIATVLGIAARAQTPASNQPEKLSRKQLLSLIATARTPAEHERIARYYRAKAHDYLAQSKEHEMMAEQYKKNPLISSSKWSVGTVNHCEFLAQSFRDDALKMNELAQLHERMAQDAAQK